MSDGTAALIEQAVRIGPQDPDEAGELVGKVGVKSKAKQLIDQVRKMYPRELRLAKQLPEHVGRSKCVDEGEVHWLAEEGFGDTFERVLGVRIKGREGDRVRPLVAVVQFEVKSGRVLSGLIPYSEMPKSQERYDRALASGDVFADEGEKDPALLAKLLADTRAELAAARAQAAS